MMVMIVRGRRGRADAFRRAQQAHSRRNALPFTHSSRAPIAAISR